MCMCSHESTSTSFTYLSLCVQGATGCAGPPVLCCAGRNSSCNRGCFCDEDCVKSGDCCPDYSSTCGQCKWRQTQRLEIHTFTFDYKCSRCKQRLLKKLQHYICNKYHNGFFVSASTVSPTLSSVSTKPTTGLSPFKSYFKNSHLHIHIVCVTPEKSV